MNHDGSWDDLGGNPSQDDSTDAWDVGGAIYGPCPTCGVGADVRCRNPITGDERNSPCISRLKGSA